MNWNWRRASGLRPGAIVLAGLWFTGAISAAGGEDLAPGVTYTVYQVANPKNTLYVVKIDRLHSEYKLKVGWSQKKRNYTALDRTSTIFARYDNPPSSDVLSAINGAYFDVNNPPRLIGTNQSDGEMLDTPSFNPSYTYHTFMVGPDRRPTIRTNFNHLQGTLTFADGYSMTLNQYNFYMNGPLYPVNGVAAFTPTFDSSTHSDFSINPALGVEVILTNVSYPMRSNKEVSGIVSAIQTGTASSNNAIPAGGMVLTAWASTKSPIVTHAHVGDRLRMRFLTDADEYNNSDNAVTGEGWIIHNGAPYNPTGWSNLESGSYVSTRAPRSILAWNNDYWFQVVCDGRSAVSLGMTFQETSDFLIGTLGAQEALNLDGGGSATMVVNGTVRNVPSDGSERYVANAVLLVKQSTATVFPFSDPFASGGRVAGWDDKFTYADVIPFSPVSPGGDGYVLKVANPSGGVETTRRGDFGDTNYSVEGDIYCEYRPGDAGDGFERYALFARDSGTGALGLSTFGGGNCYAMTYDSDDGRLRAGKYVNGTLTDFLDSSPLYQAASAWHHFRIDCYGSRIRYWLDGTHLLAFTDSTFPRGYFGIGYHDFFATNANIHGTRADNLHAFVAPLPVPADFDWDGDVDQEDFGHLQACLTGDGNPQADPACLDARLDADDDVDDADVQIFLNCASGANIPADPACAG